MALNDVEKPIQPAPYKAKQVQGPLPQYDAMRARLSQRTNADTQSQQDAMQRRFAAQGGLNSGAALKQQQLIAEKGVQTREDAMEGVNNQESAERQRLQEAEAQKEFQSQEAASGRQFQAGESALGRQFQASESALGRAQQKSQFDQDLAFRDKVAGWEHSDRMKQLDMAGAELAFNKAMAASQMDPEDREWLKYLNGGNFDINAAMEGIAAAKAQRERERESGGWWGGIKGGVLGGLGGAFTGAAGALIGRK